jgi:hypothetical protein
MCLASRSSMPQPYRLAGGSCEGVLGLTYSLSGLLGCATAVNGCTPHSVTQFAGESVYLAKGIPLAMLGNAITAVLVQG